MSEPVIHVLDNGMTIAVDPMPTAHSAKINLQMRAGSRHDPEDAQGMAHFAEHMLFKGAGRLDSDAQAEMLENVGVDINAWTSMDHMAIDFRSLPEHVPMCLGIAADMVATPWLRDADIVSERGVVLSEMDGLGDEDLLMETLHSVAYPGQPYSRRTIGDAMHLRSITGGSMREWIETRMRPRDMVLGVAGGVEVNAVVDAANEAFGSLPDVPSSPTPAAPVFHHGRGTERSRMGQGSLAVMWDAPWLADERRDAWNIAMKVLGGSPSSRLFRRLRQDLGLCYDVQTSLHASVDVGQALVQVVTEPGNVKRVWREVRDVIAASVDQVTQQEVDRARTRERVGMTMSRDYPGSRSDIMSYSVLDQGRMVPTGELMRRLNAVTVEDVREVLAKLVEAPRALANVGGGSAAIA